MANGKSDIATLQDTPTRTGAVPGITLGSDIRIARFLITLLGTEAGNEYHELGKIPLAGYKLVPERCQIRHVTGTYSLISRIQRVRSGTATNQSAALTHANGTASTSLGFAATDNLEPLTNIASDTLRLLLSTVTTTNAGAQFVVEIAYRPTVG